jgi:hypothetical protein
MVENRVRRVVGNYNTVKFPSMCASFSSIVPTIPVAPLAVLPRGDPRATTGRLYRNGLFPVETTTETAIAATANSRQIWQLSLFRFA